MGNAARGGPSSGDSAALPHERGLSGDAKAPPGKAPAPPNVLLVWIADAGFGMSSAFGGPCATPTIDDLAAKGLKYVRFHAAGGSDATRAALLSGRDPAEPVFGDARTDADVRSEYRRACTFVPDVLANRGYATATFTTARYAAAAGREAGGERPPSVEDLAGRAISWIHRQTALAPERPFFAYVATGSDPVSRSAPDRWMERNRGRFHRGWDRIREETLAQQRSLGVVPSSCRLSPRPPEVPAWQDVPAGVRPALVRRMEAHAAALCHVDDQLGRIVQSLGQLGILENTLVFVILGGADTRAEGAFHYRFDEIAAFADDAQLGRERSLSAWLHAVCAPYRWTTRNSPHLGGTRLAAVVHWPRGIRSKGEIRRQFHHVTDVAPTIFEAAGVREPLVLDGVAQRPLDGVSMTYSFDAPDAAGRRDTLVFGTRGRHGVYRSGWSAVSKRRIGRDRLTGEPLIGGDWELFDTDVDWSEAEDLAAARPDKLRELQRAWLAETSRRLAYRLLAARACADAKRAAREVRWADVTSAHAGQVPRAEVATTTGGGRR